MSKNLSLSALLDKIFSPNLNLVVGGMMLGIAGTRSMSEPNFGFWVIMDLLLAAVNFLCYYKSTKESKNGT